MTLAPAAWCEKFDMPASGCAHCRGIPDLPAEHHPRTGKLGPWVTAQFPARCGCGAAIVPGDQIRAANGSWLCEGCGDG
jgi:hypothetical protein